MKTIYLLFAVACLAFYVQSNPKPQPEDLPQDVLKNLDAVEDDRIGMEDADIAKDPDVQATPSRCLFVGGVCQQRKCSGDERVMGICSQNVPCCSRQKN